MYLKKEKKLHILLVHDVRISLNRKAFVNLDESVLQSNSFSSMVVGCFGHGRFGLGQFGLGRSCLGCFGQMYFLCSGFYFHKRMNGKNIYFT